MCTPSPFSSCKVLRHGEVPSLNKAAASSVNLRALNTCNPPPPPVSMAPAVILLSRGGPLAKGAVFLRSKGGVHWHWGGGC